MTEHLPFRSPQSKNNRFSHIPMIQKLREQKELGSHDIDQKFSQLGDYKPEGDESHFSNSHRKQKTSQANTMMSLSSNQRDFHKEPTKFSTLLSGDLCFYSKQDSHSIQSYIEEEMPGEVQQSNTEPDEEDEYGESLNFPIPNLQKTNSHKRNAARMSFKQDGNGNELKIEEVKHSKAKLNNFINPQTSLTPQYQIDNTIFAQCQERKEKRIICDLDDLDQLTDNLSVSFDEHQMRPESVQLGTINNIKYGMGSVQTFKTPTVNRRGELKPLNQHKSLVKPNGNCIKPPISRNTIIPSQYPMTQFSHGTTPTNNYNIPIKNDLTPESKSLNKQRQLVVQKQPSQLAYLNMSQNPEEHITIYQDQQILSTHSQGSNHFNFSKADFHKYKQTVPTCYQSNTKQNAKYSNFLEQTEKAHPFQKRNTLEGSQRLEINSLPSDIVLNPGYQIIQGKQSRSPTYCQYQAPIIISEAKDMVIQPSKSSNYDITNNSVKIKPLGSGFMPNMPQIQSQAYTLNSKQHRNVVTKRFSQNQTVINNSVINERGTLPSSKGKRQIVLKKAEGEDDKFKVVNSRSFMRQSKNNFNKYLNQEMTPDKQMVNRAKANLTYLEEILH